jgi:hypothetical protein
MVQVRFTAEFRHWVRRSRKHCVLCKALRMMVYPAGAVVEVDAETARAATAAGAGAVLGPGQGDGAQ